MELDQYDSYTRLYNIHRNMLARCYNSNAKYYKDYGERGIIVCETWRTDFKEFKKWAFSTGYTEQLTLDRKDNNLNYTPENCRWKTMTIQMQNSRVLSTSNTSGFRGVSKHGKNWRAALQMNGIRHNLGTYETKLKAHNAVKKFVAKYATEHNV